MVTPFLLLKCIGKVILKKGLDVLVSGLPVSKVLLEVAGEILEEWRKRRRDRERLADLEAVARASARELSLQVAEVVGEVAGRQPEAVRQNLRAYLMQVPGT